MTELTSRFEILRDVDNWFAHRGFGLVISKGNGGDYCASLFSKRSFEVTAPEYGCGSTPEAAANGARDRYIEEEGE